MVVSVIIPVLNEEKVIGRTLAALKQIGLEEVIVVDGGSSDQTVRIAEENGAIVISSRRGRADQMNRGAGEAKGEILLFLHVDTSLPATAIPEITAALANPKCVGGRFDVELDGRRRILKLIGKMISLRSRVTKVATGDQAIFVRRTVFGAIGGFPEIPLMEDIAFSRMLKRRGEIACLSSRVVTSARRWEEEGVWRTILKMWILRVLFLAGVSPSRLKRFYADAR